MMLRSMKLIVVTTVASVCALIGTTRADLYSVAVNYDLAPDQLRTVDPADGSTISSVTITSVEGGVNGANGLAVDPTTGIMYAVLQISGGVGRTLHTIDPDTGVATLIGALVDSVAGIAFDSKGQLYSVSGDGGSTPETLFKVDKANAIMVVFLPLGAGEDGETIGYNPDDGLMYHASGIDGGVKVWESIDLSIPAVASSIVLPDHVQGKIPEEILAFTYADGGAFYMADRISGGIEFDSGFFLMATDGTPTFVGEMDHVCKGLAVWPLEALCPEDLDGDGLVNAADLAQLLGAWGPCAGCPADLTGDDVVNAADLAQLLGSWGPCN